MATVDFGAPISPFRSPQSANWESVKVIAERNALLSRVEDNAAMNPVATKAAEILQSPEVTLTDSRGCLDFDSDQPTGGVLKHDIYLLPFASSEVKQLRPGLTPADLFAQFHHHKVLQEGPDPGWIPPYLLLVQTGQVSS